MTKQFSRIGFIGAATLAAFFLAVSIATPQAHAAMASQMSLGSEGNDVTALQQFLATNYRIYPAALVTGHYGPLTQAAVRQFQVNYDISQVGAVGPTTLARMNSVISSGLGLDISGPAISSLNLQTGIRGATVSWNTDTLANGKVFYDTQPLQSSDATISFAAPYVSGSVAQGGASGYSQSIALPNLLPNTTYYTLVESTDASGNVSVAWPGQFRTN